MNDNPYVSPPDDRPIYVHQGVTVGNYLVAVIGLILTVGALLYQTAQLDAVEMQRQRTADHVWILEDVIRQLKESK